MQELKLKAWHKKEKMFKRVNGIRYITEYGKPCFCIDIQHEGINEFVTTKEVELIKFIGVKDKNNKDIYKGDIVKVKYSDDTSLSNALYLCFVIKWDNLTCAFYGEQIKNEIYTGGRRDAEFWRKGEVIGNKFENPELLK